MFLLLVQLVQVLLVPQDRRDHKARKANRDPLVQMALLERRVRLDRKALRGHKARLVLRVQMAPMALTVPMDLRILRAQLISQTKILLSLI
tara:strand:- start:485 stop:757 length:273 start_codon:yes stop_codon:yes gene_type:complete